MKPLIHIVPPEATPSLDHIIPRHEKYQHDSVRTFVVGATLKPLNAQYRNFMYKNM
jgi:hypothetical protein